MRNERWFVASWCWAEAGDDGCKLVPNPCPSRPPPSRDVAGRDASPGEENPCRVRAGSCDDDDRRNIVGPPREGGRMRRVYPVRASPREVVWIVVDHVGPKRPRKSI